MSMSPEDISVPMYITLAVMQVLPDDFDPTSSPGYLVARLARLLARRNDELLARLGVSVAWLPVLGALRQGETLAQKELARRAEIGQPAMAQMLARMERDGFLVSTPDPDDRRARRYRLTETGRACVEPAVATVRDANDAIFGCLTKMKQRTLVALLREVSSALGEDAHAERERATRRNPRGRRR
ncbi:MarR family winged helix-turn-helix transcriptional regulator [Sorangium sp. So ce381]|uniref:MarR family winged helix-turn-helix transcriptional regulator n=1 Tax=Sorangium sp. So ce381 TaxID=3133307 RepID=UPI003F5BB686